MSFGQLAIVGWRFWRLYCFQNNLVSATFIIKALHKLSPRVEVHLEAIN